jgi:hypothetical protein
MRVGNPVPDSAQGGGSTVTELEVRELTDYLRENPTADDAQADDNERFAVASGEKKADKARSRTGSAADRMRKRVAEELGLEEDHVTAAVRAVDHDAKGKPRRYSYWLLVTAAGQKVLAPDA